MKLIDWLYITEGRVTEGSDFMFPCYGDKAYSLLYWNGQHGRDEISLNVVYDRKTFEVYEAEIFDGSCEITYIWRSSNCCSTYDDEFDDHSNPEWIYVLLETEEDFIKKATSIVNRNDSSKESANI